MTPQTFKPGDHVKCIYDRGMEDHIRKGQNYVVKYYTDQHLDLVSLWGVCGECASWRFQRVPSTPQPKPTMPTTQLRDSLGRFTNATVSVQPVVTKQLTLRPGSLYRVSGQSVARFVATVKGGIAVLKVHGKPIAVPVERVRLADKEDVEAYLLDSK